jgi:hypothetical protein
MIDRDAAKLWIIDNQSGRRNLHEYDRIVLQDKRREIVQKQAKENLKTPTGGLTSAKLPKSQKPIDTRKVLAKAARVGERTFDARGRQPGDSSPESTTVLAACRRSAATRYPSVVGRMPWRASYAVREAKSRVDPPWRPSAGAACLGAPLRWPGDALRGQEWGHLRTERPRRRQRAAGGLRT